MTTKRNTLLLLICTLIAVIVPTQAQSDQPEPEIRLFESDLSVIQAETVERGEAYIGVRWQVINRPENSNLYFEQLLPDGTARNAELPRDFVVIPDYGLGTVLPILPSEVVPQLAFRLRVADMDTGETYISQQIQVDLIHNTDQPGEPEIRLFTIGADSVTADTVEAGEAYLPVRWQVINRPQNSNLYFEQILPDGSARNAELPRDFILIPDYDSGTVLPILPSEPVPQLVFRLRVADVDTDETYVSQQLSIDLYYTTLPTPPAGIPTQDATANYDEWGNLLFNVDECFSAPFAAPIGLERGAAAKVRSTHGGAGTGLYSGASTLSTYITMLDVDTELRIVSDVICLQALPTNSEFQRWWMVETVDGNFSGWVPEYSFQRNGAAYHLALPDFVDTEPGITNFQITPEVLDIQTLEEEGLTVTWETENASSVRISLGSLYYDSLDASGTLIIPGAEINNQINTGYSLGSLRLYLTAEDTQGNWDDAEVESQFSGSDVAIQSFTASPDTVAGNGEVTFSWDIDGEFVDGSIWWVPNTGRSMLTSVTVVDAQDGTFTATMPDWTYGEYTFTLTVQDSFGLAHSAEVTVTLTCAYEWAFTQADGCPGEPVATVSGAYQTFERGMMVWLPGSGNEIWVLFNSGEFSLQYDEWDGSEVIIEETPPEGMRAPGNGFGYVWANRDFIREGLGWALGEEVSYTASYQNNIMVGRYGDYYTLFNLPDGRIIRALYESGSLPRWEVIAQ